MSDSHIIPVDEANFEAEVLKSDRLVLIEFMSDTCAPCVAMAPRLEEFAQENKDTVKVVQIKAPQSADIFQAFGIMSMPTLITMMKGQVLLGHVGGISKKKMAELVEHSLASQPSAEKPWYPQQIYAYTNDTLGGLGSGDTPLMEAARRREGLELCKALVEQGVPVNQTNARGMTPLMWAAVVGNVETAQFLIAHGADLSLKDKDGKTALDHAQGDVVAFLKKASQKSPPKPRPPSP